MTTAADELRKTLAAEEGGRVWLRRLGIFGGVAVLVAAGLGWRVTHRPPPPARFVTAPIAVGDVTEKVQATGAVQPLLQVNVGAQTNGRVTRVDVDFNSIVHKGDVLAEIDPTITQSQVTQAQAGLDAQRAQLASARANLETTKVAVRAHPKALRAEPREQGRRRHGQGQLRRRGRERERADRADQRAVGAALAVGDQRRLHEDLLAGRRHRRHARHRSGRDGRRELPVACPLRHRAGPPEDARARGHRRSRRRQAAREDGGRGGRRCVPRRDLPRHRPAGALQPEHRRGRRHVLGGRRGRKPGGEAPSRHDRDRDDQDARGEGRLARSELGAPLQAHAASRGRRRSRARRRPRLRSAKVKGASTCS